MFRRRWVVLVVGACLGTSLLWSAPASAATSTTVTPGTGLVDRQTVTVTGAGFTAGSTSGICQAIDDGSPGTDDCGLGSITPFGVPASGTFTWLYTVRRTMFVPSLGRTVNCASERCVIAAAEFSDIAGTAAFTAIAFAPGQPDGQIKSLITGAIAGDDIYSEDGVSGQTRIRPVRPGASALFAVPYENDGPSTDDITVTTRASGAPITARYSIGYYDVTAAVTGSGLRVSMAPGQTVTLAVRYEVSPSAPSGSLAAPLLTFTSGEARSTDTVRVGVWVPSTSSRRLLLTGDCSGPDGARTFGVSASVTGFPPFANLNVSLNLDGTGASFDVTSNRSGSIEPVHFPSSAPVALASFTVTYAGRTLVKTLQHPCDGSIGLGASGAPRNGRPQGA